MDNQREARLCGSRTPQDFPLIGHGSVVVQKDPIEALAKSIDSKLDTIIALLRGLQPKQNPVGSKTEHTQAPVIKDTAKPRQLMQGPWMLPHTNKKFYGVYISLLDEIAKEFNSGVRVFSKKKLTDLIKSQLLAHQVFTHNIHHCLRGIEANLGKNKVVMHYDESSDSYTLSLKGQAND